MNFTKCTSNFSAEEIALLEFQLNAKLTYREILSMKDHLGFDLPEMAYQMDRVLAKKNSGADFSESKFVKEFEDILDVMCSSVKLGIAKDAPLKTIPGDYAVNCHNSGHFDDLLGVAFWASMATNYHSARKGTVAAAPTCGSAGVLSGTLYSYMSVNGESFERLIDALKVSALGGLIAFKWGNVSGAKGGCGAEMGIGCMMAAMASAFLLGCTPRQIGHAGAFAGIMFTGMECSPTEGRVEYPCIPRNGFASNIAIQASRLAFSGSDPPFDFDNMIYRIFAAGASLSAELRETNDGPWMDNIVNRYLYGTTFNKNLYEIVDGGMEE